MRIFIEICLAVGEWFQEWNIHRAARKAAREFEKKTIFTFLSQGAVGGMLSLIVLTAYSVIANPSGYNIIMVGAMPIYSIGGALGGAIGGFFIWLVEALIKRLSFAARKNPTADGTVGPSVLNRASRFVARTTTAMIVMPSLMFAFYYLMDKRDLEQLSYSRWIGFSCTMGLMLGLTTGSSIRPCRTIIFGVEGRPVRRNFGTWLAIPFGFLLRTLSVFGIMEALMVMALWISNRRVDRDWFPLPGHLAAIVCGILYFAISAYVSLKTPRKRFLLPIAIVLNLPLVVWIANLTAAGTENSVFLAYSLMLCICLWALYTLGRLIAPEPILRRGNLGSEPRASLGGECSVQS